MEIKKKLLASMAIVGAFSMNSMAADIEAGVVKNVFDASTITQKGSLPFYSSDLYGTEYIAPQIDKSQPENLNTSDSAVTSVGGPAQGITFFEIAAVRSITFPDFDSISPDQFSTTQDHGGGQVQVLVFQFGLGNPNNATFNGASVPATITEPRCGATLTTCTPGQMVTGFLYVYDFFGSANVSGTVNVSANSVATPFGFFSDSVFIR